VGDVGIDERCPVALGRPGFDERRHRRVGLEGKDEGEVGGDVSRSSTLFTSTRSDDHID
jgi:hypothetical protein